MSSSSTSLMASAEGAPQQVPTVVTGRLLDTINYLVKNSMRVVHELLEKPTVISRQHRAAAEAAVTSARLRAQVAAAERCCAHCGKIEDLKRCSGCRKASAVKC